MPPSDNTSQPIDTNQSTAPDPNDLSTELSAEQEAEFVDRQLGITDSGAPFGVPAPTGDNDEKPKPVGDEAEGDGQKPPEASDEKKPGDAIEGAPSPVSDDQKPVEDAGKSDEQPPKTPAPEEPKPEAKAETPQTVDTSDLWVELEDANGKTFKIGVNEPIPDDLVFKNDAQLAELTEARMEMKGALREREAELKTEQDKNQAKQDSEKSEADQLASWDSEIQDLITAGLIEEPKLKPGQEGFLEDPSIKKVDAVFKFMASENVKRQTDSRPKIVSFGTAYTLWASEQAKIQKEDEQKKSNEVAKQRGALVGGGSSTSSGNSTAGLYTQGSAGSIHDVDFSDLE